MVKVSDRELLAHAERIEGKVVLFTGGGSAIGKATALLYSKHGAQVVVGDSDLIRAQAVVEEITSSGKSAVAQACDVTVWDDLVALFNLAVKTYGSVDVVVSSADVADKPWLPGKNEDGTLTPPDLSTLETNIHGTLYTASLAMAYLVPPGQTPAPDSLKALIFAGSSAAFHPEPGVVQYTSSKHAVLGIQRCIAPVCTSKGIRSGSVNADSSDASIANAAATFLAIATSPDPEASEKPWVVLDGSDVERIDNLQLDEGLYALLNSRIKGSLQPQAAK